MSDPVAVVVGVITDDTGRVLLCQRPADKSYALQWEFPGGKVEPGETPEEALVRELHEELAITAVPGERLYSKTSHYRDGGTFAVGYYRVSEWSGELENHAFAQYHWVEPAAIPGYDILEGNREFCGILAANGGR